MTTTMQPEKAVERRKRWPSLKTIAVAVGLTSTITVGLMSAVFALGFTGKTPEGRLSAVEAMVGANDSAHARFDSLPPRLTAVELGLSRVQAKVDTLGLIAESASDERAAMLYIMCALYQAQYPNTPNRDCASVPRVR